LKKVKCTVEINIVGEISIDQRLVREKLTSVIRKIIDHGDV